MQGMKLSLNRVCYKLLYFTAFVTLTTGCAEKQTACSAGFQKKEAEPTFCATKPYQMNNKIIVGSRQNDARVVYSIGKIAKVWIAPYAQGGTMIASHDNYVVVEKPHFLAGESIDRSGTKPNGAVSPTNNFPFVYRDSELDRTSNVNRFSDENIKKYNNNIYSSREAYNIPATNRSNEANANYDKKIFDFLGKSQ
jgi:hypothetical protein